MTTSMTQHLAWDSEHLGIAVAKIIPTELDYAALATTLEMLRAQKIQLVYWAVPEQNESAINAAQQQGGKCVDHKVTYLIDLNRIQANILTIDNVEFYQDNYPDNDLLQLAFDSGTYSRFRNDTNLSAAQFQAIYKEWMINSTKHLIADDVLVIRNHEQQIIGMVTVGEKNGRGDIGLLAVAENARGQQYGVRLVHSAQHYFINKGYMDSQVVTQQQNIPACKLYEKCGYRIEKVEYFYHFWL